MEEAQLQTMEEKKPGYKKTKLGWIPEDWQIVRLGDITAIDRESLSSNTDPDYIFRYVSLSDIENRKIKKGLSKIKFQNAPSRARRIVKNGDILLATVRPNLKSFAFVEDKKNENIIASTGFAVISAKPEIDGRFLFNFLLSEKIEAQIYSLVVGSNYPAINSGDVRNLKIIKPNLNEQIQIGSLIQCWNKGIYKLDSSIILKKALKKGLIQQLLTGKKRLPGFSGEWKEFKLEKFFRERNEKGFDKLPLLSVGEAGVYPQSDSNKKDTSNKDKSKYKRICPGDIGYNTMRLWQGRNALSQLEGIISPAYTVVTPKENAHAEFFKYLFKLPEVVHKFYRNSQGLVSDTLNCKFKDFKIVKVMLPPTLEEQIAIAKILLSADEEIELLKKKKDMLQTQKKGLMQQLLTGKKRLV